MHSRRDSGAAASLARSDRAPPRPAAPHRRARPGSRSTKLAASIASEPPDRGREIAHQPQREAEAEHAAHRASRPRAYSPDRAASPRRGRATIAGRDSRSSTAAAVPLKRDGDRLARLPQPDRRGEQPREHPLDRRRIGLDPADLVADRNIDSHAAHIRDGTIIRGSRRSSKRPDRSRRAGASSRCASIRAAMSRSSTAPSSRRP